MTYANALCRHGRRVGSFSRASELGAFVDSGQVQGGRDQLASDDRPLAGLAVGVKDNIDVAGQVTAAGSAVLAATGSPAAADAPVVASLKRAGLVIAARTRMDEFAMTTYGPDMRNPYDEARSVGGSSGGSAVAVAAGGFCLALGTDTGGSVRVPASYCGVVGFKPSYGRVPVEGVTPMSPSLDHVGVLACSVAAATEAFGAIAEPAARPGPTIALDRLRVGLPSAGYLAAATDEVGAAFERVVSELRAAGAETREVALPTVGRAMAIHYPISLVEAVRDHGASFNDLSRHGPEAQEALAKGREYSDQDYLDALRARTQLTDDVSEILEHVDVLALPTTPTTAPLRAAQAIRLGSGMDVDFVSGSIWYTALFNDTGLPAISIPCESVGGGMPVGLQLVTRHGGDEFLLAVAEQVQQALRGGRLSRLCGP